jgi:hypothetical protein
MDVLTATANVDGSIGLAPLAAPVLPEGIDNAKSLDDLQKMMKGLR